MISLGIAQPNLNQNIELNYEKMSVENILNDISEKYDINFSFGNLNLRKKIDFNHTGTLTEGLTTLLKKQNILYKEIGDQWVLKQDIPIGQPIKGVILDIDNQSPLIGANIVVLNSDPLIGTSSDIDGTFRLENLRVGRYDIGIDYLGYETRVIKQVLVTTGKQVALTVEMKESSIKMEEVVVIAKQDVSKPLNDMATNSARSFSIEEASRFAAAISDPARMALSFAGVTANGDDLTNEIIVRGNSSRGLLWRLEGIEIPNPNHFSSLGAGSGSISMLSVSTLSNSDFYTGAFPAEFGNATSGVFDLKLRKGNSEKREHSFQIGTLGIEASSEGYLKKGSNASYLVNYRYSTIALVDQLLPTVEGDTKFQDLSFKINLPTKKLGVFSIFGLGGLNFTGEGMQADTSNYQFTWQLQTEEINQGMGVVGLTNKKVLNNKSYLRTSIATSLYDYDDLTIRLNPDNDFIGEVIDVTDFKHQETTFNIVYNYKFNARNTLRAGYAIRHGDFKYDFKSFSEGDTLVSFLNNSGSTQLMDAYAQWKCKIGNKLELNTGVNVSLFLLNNTYAIDPRLGLKYNLNSKQHISLSTGLYSKPEHISTYFIKRGNADGSAEKPNFDLPMVRAFHLVGGYDIRFNDKLRFKAEAYYQYLFNVPVGSKANSFFSTINTNDIFSLIFFNDLDGAKLLPDGTGKNYGIDLTFEKFFSDGFYYLITGSVFDSKFTTADGREYRTRYATNFVTNLLGGKEWTVGKQQKNILGINGKFNYLEGLRTTPILRDQSMDLGFTVYDMIRFNEIKRPSYYRIDVGISYKINQKKMTHTISADIQNVTNRFNDAGSFYDPISDKIITQKQNGLIPFINYRVEF